MNCGTCEVPTKEDANPPCAITKYIKGLEMELLCKCIYKYQAG